jgi:hypothetical protein
MDWQTDGISKGKLMENSFLVTRCGFCGEGYFVTEIGIGHRCEISRDFQMEPIGPKELENPEDPVAFSSGRRIRGY